MATTEELLEKLTNLAKAQLFLDSNALCHLLLRVYGTAYVDFFTAHLTVELDPGETLTASHSVPVDKVKVAAWFKWTFEVQRKFTVKWVRDGKVFMDSHENMVDWELVPPYGYESWYPTKHSAIVYVTNNDTVARSVTADYTYYYIDKKLFDAIEGELKKIPEMLELRI